MTNNNNGRTIYRWILGIFITIIFGLIGVVFASHEKAIDKLDKEKADKEVINLLVEQNKKIEQKLDDLILFHMKENTKKSQQKKITDNG